MTFKIDDLFVPLDLVERQRPSKSQDIDSAELGSRLYQPTENGKNKFDHQQQFFDQVIRDCNTPNSKGKRIAIIGVAGSGKTTLLQKIGDQLPQNSIPIWISLKRKGNQPLDQYLIGDWLRNAAEVLDTVAEEWKTALEELLKTEKVFLLLDGVDEMTTTSPLQAIGEQINQYKIFDSVRVILTCRSNLWEDYALPGFDAYQNLDFDYPTQVEQFIDQFFQNST
jgi:predicted NACHT family NTPase